MELLDVYHGIFGYLWKLFYGGSPRAKLDGFMEKPSMDDDWGDPMT